MCLPVVSNDYFSNYSELLQSSGSVLMETRRLRAKTYANVRNLNELNPNFMKKNILSFPKSNSQKIIFSTSPPKHNKVES